jgi:two-component system chemotaxis response regulator CheY
VKALVVEDDFVSRKMLQKMLLAHGDADVAVSGEEAFDAFQEALSADAPYDVLFLDINLPGISGHDVLKKVREHERSLGIEGLDGCKIIMATGRNDKEAILSAFREGCEAYIKKPFSKDDIESKLVEFKLTKSAT